MKKYIIPALLGIALIASFALQLTAAAGDSKPIAENLELTTYRNVSVGGSLSATDPDGDTVTFEMTTDPVKGTIDLNEDGSFVYTPKENQRGKDYFGFRAVDCDGNRSSEGTVIITVTKQKTGVFYQDMSGDPFAAAAVALAEKGLFTGECVGGKYLFSPETVVSRGEFITMCVELTGCDVLSGVMTTGFGDDAAIPGYMKPYVSTALLSGVITGQGNGYEPVTANTSTPVSYAEAAVMLNRALSLTDVSYVDNSEELPAWAMQACANLSACNISAPREDDALTRAECAAMLSEAIRLMDRR